MSLIAELERVGELLAKATEGPWRWSENGNILGHMPDGYDPMREVCAVYTDVEATGEPDAPAIIAAVNFLRSHGPALREALVEREALRTALHQCEFCLRTLLPNDADAVLSAHMAREALADAALGQGAEGVG